jgi:hypothetical protein
MNKVKIAVFLIFLGAISTLLLNNAVAAYQKSKPAAPTSKPTAAPKGKLATSSQPTGGQLIAVSNKYTQPFDHFTKAENPRQKAHMELTQAQSCEKCHAWEDTKPREDKRKPYHNSCVGCHSSQFTDPKLEICADCHVKPYGVKPKDTPMQILNQFGMEFSHTSHQTRANFKCETCHNTPSDGKTVRSTYPDHPECFTCHTEENKPAKGLCNECHNQTAKAQKFRTRGQIDIAYKYFKFNHGLHLIQPRVQNRCDECHDVTTADAANATDISRIKIVFSQDLNKVHKSTCFKCHEPQPPATECNKCHTQPTGSLGAVFARDKVKLYQ